MAHDEVQPLVRQANGRLAGQASYLLRLRLGTGEVPPGNFLTYISLVSTQYLLVICTALATGYSFDSYCLTE